VLQHTLFARALPTPERLSTLLARLGAVMGEDRIGAPAAVDSYRPGAFAMAPFATAHEDRHAPGARPLAGAPHPAAPHEAPSQGGDDRSHPAPTVSSVSALRRYRQPIPARVVVDGGSPVRITTDRRGYAGGRVRAATGPWRTSGEWWTGTAWNRDEWDVALDDGVVYRVFRDRDRDAWFIDALFD
jgi:protein ImuB